MNTASQNLQHHLSVLKEKLQHPTDYELALGYFLEEFAGDVNFVLQSEEEQALHIKSALLHIAGKTLGKQAEFDHFRALRLREHGFYHGNAAAAGRVILFFFFEKLDTGLMAIIPGVSGPTEVGRFRLTGMLAADPKRN